MAGWVIAGFCGAVFLSVFGVVYWGLSAFGRAHQSLHEE